MKFQYLPWDSEFFGMRIARVDVATQEDVRALDSVDKSQWNLIYIFSRPDIDIHQNGVLLVDQKVIYEKAVGMVCEDYQEIYRFQGEQPSDKLYGLAIQSGLYSRYKTDENFPEDSFERLYRRWIEQSVSGNMADVVLCHGVGKNMDGMLTLKINELVGQIGLVAVDEKSRGNGIGSRLIQSSEFFLSQNGIKKLEVATQLTNRGACHYYQKNGFYQKSITNVYHWWVNR